MKFIDRKEEIRVLQQALSKRESPAFVVIYGRRRLGKSTLIKQVLHNNDIYFMAADMVDSVQLQMLQAQIAMHIPQIANGKYESWGELLGMLNDLITQRCTLVLDEFPYLVKRSPELPSILQRMIDSGKLNFNIVICGSSQRMMQNLVLSAAEPLYGRANAMINLQPIPPSYIAEALNVDAVAAVEEHSVWGGVPRYWEIRHDYDTLDKAISDTMLSTTAIFYDEPKKLFLDDMVNPVQPASLLSVIASGASRLSEIAARMGRASTSLGTPLEKLIQMNYLRRELPWGESPLKSRKSLYHIADPLINFYYTFVVPNLSNIGRGRKAMVMDDIRHHFSGYVAAHWEYLCREAVSGNTLGGKRWNEASRWWGKVPLKEGKRGDFREMEFDVIAGSTDGSSLLVGECKWTNAEMATPILEELKEKASLLPFAQHKKIEYVLFLREAPKDQCEGCTILLPKDVLAMTYG